MMLISARGSEGALQAPPVGSGAKQQKQSIFRFYIASNPSKVVKNIISLINLWLIFFIAIISN